MATKNTKATEQDDWFEGFGGAQVRGQGNYINAGVYNIRIMRLVRRTSEKPDTKGHKMVILEGEVDEVLVSYPRSEDGDYAASNAKGERVSAVFNLTKNPDLANGELKALLLAALNDGRDDDELLAQDSLNEEQWNAAIRKATEPPGEELKGKMVRAQATRMRAKKSGKAITPPAWSRYIPTDSAEDDE